MEGIDKNTFKQVFYDHWDAFKQAHPRFDCSDYNDTIEKMLDCGDAEKMGLVQYRCCQCGEIRCIAGIIESYEAKLGNESFVSRAKPEFVEQTRQKLAEMKEQLEAIGKNLAELK